METVVGETDFPQFIYQRKPLLDLEKFGCDVMPPSYTFSINMAFEISIKARSQFIQLLFLCSQQIACQALKLLLHKKKRY